MKAAKIIVSVGLALVLVLVGGIAYLAVYLDQHKGLLEAGASRALGRQVKIEGGATLVWSMPPRVGLDGVWIANPAWARGEYFARAERIAAQVDMWALLSGRVKIRRMTLLKADVGLEAGPEGGGNWTFGAGGHGSMTFQVDSLQVRNSSLRYQPAAGPTHEVDITTLDLQGLGGETLALEAGIRLHGLVLDVSASAGPVDQEGWPFTARIHTDDAALEASGRALAPLVLPGLTVNLDVKGQSTRSLQALLRQERLPEGPFQIGAQLTAGEGSYQFQDIHGAIGVPGEVERIAVSQGEATLSDNGILALSLEGFWKQVPASVSLSLQRADGPTGVGGRQLDLAARLGDTEVSGNLELVSSEPRPRITGDLSSTRVNLRDFAGPAQAGDRPPIWREVPLPRALLRSVDLDVTVKAKDLAAERLRLDGFQTRVRLDDGRLQLDGLDASLPGLRVTGRATLDTRRDPPALDTELRSGRLDLPKALQGHLPPHRLQGSLLGVSARLKSSGATPGDLIANLRGTLEANSARLKLPGQRPADINLEKPRVSIAPGAPLGLRTGLAFREQNFDIQGNLGQLSDLLAGSGVVLDLRVRNGDMKARVDGTLARLDGLAGNNLTIDVSGPSFARLGAVFGTELPESQPFELTGRLEAGTGSLTLKELKVVSGESDLKGQVRIVSGPKTRLEATLDSRLLDVTPYLPMGSVSLDDTTTALAKELPLESLHGLDGVLRLKAGHLRFGDLGVDDLNLDFSLDAGHLRLKMAAGEERLVGDVELKPEETQWRLTLKHKGKLKLGSLLEAGHPGGIADEAPLALDIHLSGVGRSPQTLLASADGHLEVVVGAGRINKKLGVLMPMGDILVTLLNTIGSSSREERYTSLECAVIQLDVAKGIATSSQGIALQTDAFNVLGSGALKLGTGEIEFHFKTAQRKGLGISILGIANKFIRFTGTIRQPQVAVDPAGFLIHGGAAWATGGLSLLYTDLANRLTAFSNPCETVLKRKVE